MDQWTAWAKAIGERRRAALIARLGEALAGEGARVSTDDGGVAIAGPVSDGQRRGIALLAKGLAR